MAVLPDYRLCSQVTFLRFDADGARALAWVEQQIRPLGGNSHHIILMGHSAGGHVATFLAVNHGFLRQYGAGPSSISGLVGPSGLYVVEPPAEAPEDARQPAAGALAAARTHESEHR
jgi:arylformamidase